MLLKYVLWSSRSSQLDTHMLLTVTVVVHCFSNKTGSCDCYTLSGFALYLGGFTLISFKPPKGALMIVYLSTN